MICSALLALYALFTPATPHLVIAMVLVVASFFRSLQFTCLNAAAFADVPEKAMSGATSLVGVAQQLFLSTGVAFAAFILETLRAWRGTPELAPADFSSAFLIVAVLTAMAAFMHARLPTDAGNTVSGHHKAS